MEKALQAPCYHGLKQPTDYKELVISSDSRTIVLFFRGDGRGPKGRVPCVPPPPSRPCVRRQRGDKAGALPGLRGLALSPPLVDRGPRPQLPKKPPEEGGFSDAV